MDNELKVMQALEQGPASYAELEQRSGVAPGSFGRVLRGLVERGLIAKSSQRYHFQESDISGGDSAIGPAERSLDKPKSGVAGVYSARHGGMVPWADKLKGERYEDYD